MNSNKLVIYSPINEDKIEYNWNETTTLGMLLNYVIKAFDLEEVENDRIRLVITGNFQINLKKYSNDKLSTLNLKNNATVWIKLFDSLQEDTVCVHIQCTNVDRILPLYVPRINTIAELNKKIEHCLVIVHELYSETNEKFDLNDYFQTLKQLNIQSDQIIYAKPQLSIYPPILRNQIQTKDKVIIKCRISSTEIVHIIASVKDTVSELRRRIVPYLKDRSSISFKFRLGEIIIDDKQLNRCLAEFGIKSGSTIDAQMNEFNLKNKSIISSSNITPIGLINKRNSCFMNSALQCLVHIIPLTQYFLNSIDQNRIYGKVTDAYIELLHELQSTDHSKKGYLPHRLRKAISKIEPRFGTNDEQDAQEFLNLLLNTIHEELQSNNSLNRETFIQKLFFGKIESLITCLECGTVKTNVEKLQFISLPLHRQQRQFCIEFHSKKGHQSQINVLVFASGRVEHLVKTFVDKRGKSNLFDRIIVQTMGSNESLDFSSPLYMLTDSEVKMIEQTNHVKRTLPIQLKIHPTTIIECLEEFISIEYLQDTWICTEPKCNKKTRATKQIQLCTLPPVLIFHLKRFTSKNGVQKKIKTFITYPIDGLDLRNSSTTSGAIYDLIAVSNHHGETITSGHYTAFTRPNVSTNQWYKVDDTIVSTVSSISEIITADAYLLFYIKRNYQIK